MRRTAPLVQVLHFLQAALTSGTVRACAVQASVSGGFLGTLLTQAAASPLLCEPGVVYLCAYKVPTSCTIFSITVSTQRMLVQSLAFFECLLNAPG